MKGNRSYMQYYFICVNSDVCMTGDAIEMAFHSTNKANVDYHAYIYKLEWKKHEKTVLYIIKQSSAKNKGRF